GPLHVARERAAGGFDLPRRDPLRLHRLQPELAERQSRGAGRDPVDAALVRLAEFRSHRLQHGGRLFSNLLLLPSGRIPARPAGIALGHGVILGHGIALHVFALEDPDLDPAGAVGGESGGDAVIDVGAQGVQRHAALAIPLHARDFGTAETAGAIDADAAGAEPHGRLHGALHGAAESDAALELLRDRFSDELRIEFGLADFDDVDHDIAVGELGDMAAQLLDVGALLADHHARTRRVNGDAALLVRALDDDFRHRRLLELLQQHFADFHVLVQERAVARLAGIPARIPSAVDAKPKPDWIDLLTHVALLSRSALRLPRLDLTHDNGEVRERLENFAHAAARARGVPFHPQSLADMRLRDDEIVDV